MYGNQKSLPHESKREAKKLVSGYYDDRREFTVVEQCGYTNPENMSISMIDCWYAEHGGCVNPSRMAAAAIYASRLTFNRRVTQKELSEEFQIPRTHISSLYGTLFEYVQNYPIDDETSGIAEQEH